MKSQAKGITFIALILLLLICGLAWADETELFWSTFLGGSASDEGRSIAVDASGNVYVTGQTNSETFPTTSGAWDTLYSGGEYDAFVVKLDPMGKILAYSTFIGGSDRDEGFGIAIDGSCNVYVTGRSRSVDFPTTPEAFDTLLNGYSDAFGVKLNSTGNSLSYSTFLGASEREHGFGIALDKIGCAYISGRTSSADFPTTTGALSTSYNGGDYDAFVVKLNPTGSEFDYSTFLGGSEYDDTWAIALDSLCNAYLTGHTWSADFPTTMGTFDTTYNGNYDAYAAKLNPLGNDLIFSGFLGGSDADRGYAIAVDDFCNAYIAGKTASIDFPNTNEAYDTTYNNGEYDAFVVKLESAGSFLAYATFLGGSETDVIWGIVLDESGSAFVTGETGSPDFPTTANAFDTTHNDSLDAFVAKLSTADSALYYSTFLGGNSNDYGWGIAVFNPGIVYLTGYTESANFPGIAGYDLTHNGSFDAFVAKFDLSDTPVPVVLASFEATAGQGYITLDWITASEVGCHRWEVHRSEREDGEYEQISELSGYGSTEKDHTYRWVDRQVSPGTTYFYKLKQVDFDGSSTWSPIVSAIASSDMPKTYDLNQNYPNPFNASTEIRYQIPADSHVILKVFNAIGQEVRTIVDRDQKAGDYGIIWDGRDNNGLEVTSGFYFCRLKTGDFAKTIKMVLIK